MSLWASLAWLPSLQTQSLPSPYSNGSISFSVLWITLFPTPSSLWTHWTLPMHHPSLSPSTPSSLTPFTSSLGPSLLPLCESPCQPTSFLVHPYQLTSCMAPRGHRSHPLHHPWTLSPATSLLAGMSDTLGTTVSEPLHTTVSGLFGSHHPQLPGLGPPFTISCTHLCRFLWMRFCGLGCQSPRNCRESCHAGHGAAFHCNALVGAHL